MKTISFICILIITNIFIYGFEYAKAQETCQIDAFYTDRPQVVNYFEFYKNMMGLFNVHESASGSFREATKNLTIETARHWINSCPTFFTMINNDVLPQHKPGTGSILGDIYAGSLLEHKAGDDIKRVHPQLKRWLNRVQRMRW